MPIVKPHTFHEGGHHASCADRRGYLMRDDRHLSVDVINLSSPETWDREMDETRRSFGLPGDVTYREYVISPAEEDHATPSQVRDLSLAWARRNFPTCECAVIVHDDNSERLHDGRMGLAHAHVVVNSVELDTGRKVSISNERVRELHNSLQDIAGRMGLSRIKDYRRGERLESRQGRVRTQAERQMEIRGIEPWKESVRQMAIQAKDASRTLADFRRCLNEADVDLEVRGGRVFLVDRDNPDRACRADRLDSSLSAHELARKFERADRTDLSPEARQRHLARKLREEIDGFSGRQGRRPPSRTERPSMPAASREPDRTGPSVEDARAAAALQVAGAVARGFAGRGHDADDAPAPIERRKKTSRKKRDGRDESSSRRGR